MYSKFIPLAQPPHVELQGADYQFMRRRNVHTENLSSIQPITPQRFTEEEPYVKEYVR